MNRPTKALFELQVDTLKVKTPVDRGFYLPFPQSIFRLFVTLGPSGVHQISSEEF